MKDMKKLFLKIYYSVKTPFVCLLLSWAFFCFILNEEVVESFRVTYQLWVTGVSLFVGFGLFYYEVLDKARYQSKKEAIRNLKNLGETETYVAFRQVVREIWYSPRIEVSILFIFWALFAVITSDYRDPIFIGVSIFVVCCFLLNAYNHCKRRG